MIRSPLSRLAVAFLLGLAPAAFATERVVTLEPQSTDVSFYLEATGHDVEGHLRLAAGELHLDPDDGSASGEVKIGIEGAETGNKKRDKTMHNKVFETETYPWIVFTPSRFEGELPDSGSGEVEIFGTVAIHGGEHPLSLPTKVEIDGDSFQGETTFAVPYVEWGMKDPSIMFLKVAKEVAVTVKASGVLR